MFSCGRVYVDIQLCSVFDVQQEKNQYSKRKTYELSHQILSMLFNNGKVKILSVR